MHTRLKKKKKDGTDKHGGVSHAGACVGEVLKTRLIRNQRWGRRVSWHEPSYGNFRLRTVVATAPLRKQQQSPCDWTWA